MIPLHQSLSLDKSHEPSMRFVFNKTPIKEGPPNISDHRTLPLSFASCHPQKGLYKNRKTRAIRAKALVFLCVPVINYGFIGVREKQNRCGLGEKIRGGRLIIVRRHCSAALLNWQKEISWPTPPWIVYR